MRRPDRRLTLRAALLVLAMTALAGFPAGAAEGDSVHGFGRITLEEIGIPDASLEVSINARSGPNGENPSGTMRVDQTGNGSPFGPHNFSGVADVTCLRVDGNEATVAGKLRRPVPNPNSPGTEYQHFAVIVTDEGTPGVGADTIINAVVNWGPPGERSPLPCRFGFEGGIEIVAGNFTVRDAT